MPGLFATAYGNVGSSIYYALGLVAAHALGLTPVVFIFAGGLFALTAKTYAEGASMFPEAGGSSSFARHAFNEVASFFAGWALTLDYIITIAISAFFVPHYLGAFFPALAHNPGDIIGGAVVIAVLAALNIRGLGESTKLNIFLAVADLLHAGRAGRCSASSSIFDPHVLVNQVHLGVAPSWTEVVFALSISMIAYTGIETVSNMAEEARDPATDVPKTVNYVLIAVLGIFAGISIISLIGAAGHPGRGGPLLDRARHHLQGRPGARDRLGAAARHGWLQTAAPLLRRRPGGDDPADRHQRRADRDLAPVVVAGRAPPAPRVFSRLHPATARRGSRSSSSR